MENKEQEKNTMKEKKIRARGKTFQGKVVGKHHKRIAVSMERMVYVRKYERYSKSKTKVHARLPEEYEKEVNKGDIVRVQECRPLSKIVNFVFVKKVKDASDIKEGEK